MFHVKPIDEFLKSSAARHSHLCPRQVLGVRIGLAGAGALDLDIPRQDKRLWVILETDGCFADGVEVVTGCTIGHRTLRIQDYGKPAAVFADAATGRSVRIAPRRGVRPLAFAYAPAESSHYRAMLQAYQVMPENELLTIQEVELEPSLAAIISQPGIRVQCSACGEEIINQRELLVDGRILCLACAGGAYYRPRPHPEPAASPP